MKTTEPNVNTLFSSTKRYKVPLFQRDYVWDLRNWEDLWDAIFQRSELRLREENNAKTHFIGAIVIHDNRRNLVIIDGQQRLTTLQIILCAIRDVCEKFDEDPSKIVDDIEGLILNSETSASKRAERYKLLPREGSDRSALQALIGLKETETKKSHTEKESHIPKRRRGNRGSGKSRIHRAHSYFKKKIKTYVKEEYNRLDKLFSAILENFVFVQIMVDQNDDPDKIFQTINGTGQALNEFDLLRNDLFLRAGTGTKGDELYKNHWEYFDQRRFWRQGKVRDEFLRDFLKAKQGMDFNEKQKLFDQYQIYSKELSEKTDPIESENLVEYEFGELSRYAEVYQKMHDPNSDDIGQRMEFYKKFNQEFNLTPQLLKSFVLYITNELRLSPPERNLVFDILETYAVRWILCTGLIAPAAEINGLFLDVLNKKKSFNLFDLWHLLSKECQSDKSVIDILEHLFPNFNTFPSRGSSKKTRQNQISRIQKLGNYISDRIKSHPNNLKPDELRACFCEIWPSSEILLQSCLKDGLPIVYSQVPISEKVKDQLEPYIFVTYNGTKKLSKYETQQGKIVGIDEDCDSNEKFELPIEEILFAFPTIAMSGLQPYLNNIRDDVKDLTLMSVKKEKAYQVKHWLRLYTHAAENSHSKHWLLPDIDAIAVTRAGHVLRGTLKSFTDEAIHMQIEGQIVTVYMHGLLELNTTEISQSKPHIFMTYDGMRELSESVALHHHVIGREGKEKVVLDNKEILFAFPVSSMNALEPHLNAIHPVPTQENSQFENKDIKLTGQNKVKIVTRVGHVLQGIINSFDKDAIFVRINGETVKVFWHGLYDLEVVKRLPWNSTIEGKKNQPVRFMSNTGIIELSVSESSRSEIIGVDKNGEKKKILTQNVFFAYSGKIKSNNKPLKFWTDIDPPKQMPFSPDYISTYHVKNKFNFRVVTNAGHMLQGRVKSLNKETIDMEIKKQSVIIFKHALIGVQLISSGDLMLERESFKFITYAEDPIELSQIETVTYKLTGVDKNGNRIEPLAKSDILFAYSIKAALDLEPIEIDNQVEQEKLKPLREGREWFKIETAFLDSAIAEKIKVRILTRCGHVLEGTIEHFDKYEIHLRINGQTVIVYRRGVYDFLTEVEGQL